MYFVSMSTRAIVSINILELIRVKKSSNSDTFFITLLQRNGRRSVGGAEVFASIPPFFPNLALYSSKMAVRFKSL